MHSFQGTYRLHHSSLSGGRGGRRCVPCVSLCEWTVEDCGGWRLCHQVPVGCFRLSWGHCGHAVISGLCCSCYKLCCSRYSLYNLVWGLICLWIQCRVSIGYYLVVLVPATGVTFFILDKNADTVSQSGTVLHRVISIAVKNTWAYENMHKNDTAFHSLDKINLSLSTLQILFNIYEQCSRYCRGYRSTRYPGSSRSHNTERKRLLHISF